MIIKANNIPLEFHGGLNTLSGPMSIADNETPNCLNVHTNLMGTLERRKGYSELDDVTAGSNGNGIFDYRKDADTHYMVSYIGQYLYKMDVTANALDGTLDTVAFGTQMDNNTMEFEQFSDAGVEYLVMATHSRNTLQKWTGIGATTDLSPDTDMPKCKYIRQWKGYLFCANIENYESRVAYNTTSGAIKDNGDWDATDYQDIRTNDGDYITGLSLLKGRLYTFKRYSIHRWTYLGGVPLFSIKEAVSNVGAVSSKSIRNVTHPKLGEVLMFLAADANFYAFDGTQVHLLSSKINIDNGVSTFNMSKLNRDFLYKSCAVDYDQRHWYLCSVATGADNNWTVVYDYYTDSFWPFDIAMNACGLVESGGKKNVYFGQDDGAVYRFDDGNTDNGSDVKSQWDGKKLGYKNRAILKKHRYIDLHFKNTPSNIVNFYHRSDWAVGFGTAKALAITDGGFILGTSKLGDTLGGPGGVHKTVDLPVINNTEQIKIYTCDSYEPWQLYAADIVVEGLGYGGTS